MKERMLYFGAERVIPILLGVVLLFKEMSGISSESDTFSSGAFAVSIVSVLFLVVILQRYMQNKGKRSES